jgi:hypothetical protein
MASAKSKLVDQLRYGGKCSLPLKTARCPECDGELTVDCVAWNIEDGKPSLVEVTCAAYNEPDTAGELPTHHFRVETWVKVKDKVRNWVGL